ncbi:maleylpyruvate isomerase family mycothiol-dependent enzyme [Nocardioides marinquilinus]|uniref:Maleylpyruvate isomerase family mycothiol-dependent enzyme n=1 Tax=Nocardioides marinquilinus TaxID=1210400 RepID=A0ABP9PXC2_9ACTN
MTRLDPDRYLHHLRRDSARFRDVLAGCDPAARVPACPDWDADDLLWHLAEVQWFWSDVVRHRPAGPDDELEARRPARASGHEALLAQFDACSAGLVDALAAADPAEAAWHWGPEQTVLASYRRQAHEVLIHRLDAEQTAGVEPEPLDAELATDGVAEAIDLMYGGDAPAWGRIEGGEHVVRVDLTDVGVALWARPCTFLGTDPESGKTHDGPHVLLVEDPGVEADAVVSGTAADVDAWLWKRRGREGIEATGDQAALEGFMAAVTPPID